MPYVLLTIGLILGAVALYRFFLQATPQQMGALALALVTGVIAIALFVLALTGRLPAAIAIVAALWPFGVAWYRLRHRQKEPDSEHGEGPMSRADALETLGLAEEASVEEIKEAHKALMKKLHPDQKGTEGLAKRLNMAKDKLLKD